MAITEERTEEPQEKKARKKKKKQKLSIEETEHVPGGAEFEEAERL